MNTVHKIRGFWDVLLGSPDEVSIEDRMMANCRLEIVQHDYDHLLSFQMVTDDLENSPLSTIEDGELAGKQATITLLSGSDFLIPLTGFFLGPQVLSYGGVEQVRLTITTKNLMNLPSETYYEDNSRELEKFLVFIHDTVTDDRHYT